MLAPLSRSLLVFPSLSVHKCELGKCVGRCFAASRGASVPSVRARVTEEVEGWSGGELRGEALGMWKKRLH